MNETKTKWDFLLPKLNNNLSLYLGLHKKEKRVETIKFSSHEINLRA